MSNKKIDPEHWVVALSINRDSRTYQVRQVAKYDNWGSMPPEYVVAQAEDEIGAFNDARRTMARLGFTAAE